MRTPDEIVALWRQRQAARGPVLAQMAAVRDMYNGDVVVPLPEMDKHEQSFVANLTQQGLDQTAQRIASVMPNLTCPPANPRNQISVAFADTRKRATYAWWEENKISRQLRRRARWLIGYSTAPVTIRPNFTKGIPVWRPRNPMDSFAAPCADPDDLCPDDSVHAMLKTYGWLRRCYPIAAMRIAPEGTKDDRVYTVLEYDDAEQITTLVVGKPDDYEYSGTSSKVEILESLPNRAEIPWTVSPGRITLDRPLGQFDGMTGIHRMQARLMALEVLAVQKGVFPDTYLVSRPNEVAKLVGGYKPGYTGEINQIEGGDIREVAVNPSFAANQISDRLERAQRLNGGIPAEFGGESGTNIRTGRRGDAVLSAVVDFPVQEAQDTLAASLEEENRRATKIAKAYFGNTPKSFHVQWKGAKGHITYTPNKDFDSDYTQVSYAQSGSDINNLVTGMGQRVGIGLMSKQTGRKLDPMIDDPDLEGDLVVSEGLEMASLQGLQAAAQNGTLPPADLARIQQLVVEDNMPMFKAVQKAQQEAQERQATTGPQGQDTSVDPTAAAAQPGLAPPGAGAEAGAAIGPPPTSLGNLDQLFMDTKGKAT